MATILDAEKVDNDDDGGGPEAAAPPPNGLEINVEEVVVSAEAAVVMEIVVVDMEYCLIWLTTILRPTHFSMSTMPSAAQSLRGCMRSSLN